MSLHDGIRTCNPRKQALDRDATGISRVVMYTTDYPVRIRRDYLVYRQDFCGFYTICPGKDWDLTLKRVRIGPQKSVYVYNYLSYFRTIWSWMFPLNRPVTLPENLFHSLHNLLFTNNHVVSNSELQCKKFSYRVVIKVATNGTYHKISVVKPTRCTNVSNLFYYGKTLCVFRAVFPSIIRSSRLYIQQQAYVKQILLSAC